MSLSSWSLIRHNSSDLNWPGYLIEIMVGSSDGKFYLVSTKCNFVCAGFSTSDSPMLLTDLERKGPMEAFGST